jgi:DNA-binding MarR family transcriptional regulator
MAGNPALSSFARAASRSDVSSGVLQSRTRFDFIKSLTGIASKARADRARYLTLAAAAAPFTAARHSDRHPRVCYPEGGRKSRGIGVMTAKRGRPQRRGRDKAVGHGPRRGTWPAPSPIADAEGPITHAIFRIARKHRVVVGNLLRPIGLYPGQELLLMQLWERDARSQADLVDALGIDHSTVTKMLQRMAAAGLVERRASSVDRRVVVVSLTARGRRVRVEVERIWQDMERLTVGHLGGMQRADLLRLLHSIEANLQPDPASE